MEIIKIKKTKSYKNIYSMKLRVAAYVRVSTNLDDQINSFESQKLHFTEKIEKNANWELVDIYADEGISGTSLNKRDNFIRMINDVEDGKIDLILTKSVSRFARNTVDSLKYIRYLKSKNIPIFFEEENINTMNQSSELLLSVLSSVAQQESENISSYLRQGAYMMMKAGKSNNHMRPYGYKWKDDKLQIVKKEADVVKIIFQMYVGGSAIREIVRYLSDNKYKNYNKNYEWRGNTLTNIMKNKIYIGTMEMGKYEKVINESGKKVERAREKPLFVYENYCKPIIDKETFYKAQELLNKNKRPDDYETISKDKIRCGYCGSVIGVFHKNVDYICIKQNILKDCKNSVSLKEKELSSVLRECFIEYLRKDVISDNYLYSLNKELVDYKNKLDFYLKQSSQLISKYIDKKSNYLDYFVDKQKIDDNIEEYNSLIHEINKEIIKYNEFKKIYEKLYNDIIELFQEEDMFISLLKKYNFVLVWGGYNDEGKVKPSTLRIIYNWNISKLEAKQKMEEVSNIYFKDSDDSLIVMDYKSKVVRRIYKNHKLMNKSIRVILEIHKEEGIIWK